MATYARIDNGVVAELFATDGDISEMFNPALVWVGCTADVEVGRTYANGNFAAPSTTGMPADLTAYAKSKASVLSRGGCNITVGSKTYLFATDPTSRTNLLGEFIFVQADPTQTAQWQFDDGVTTFSAQEFSAIAFAVRGFIQAISVTLGNVLASIAANTITNVTQIDGAAWPSNSIFLNTP